MSRCASSRPVWRWRSSIELGVDPSVLGPDTDPSTLSPEVQAFIEEVMANPPHMAQGMIQEFVVTAEGTEVGPLPASRQ